MGVFHSSGLSSLLSSATQSPKNTVPHIHAEALPSLSSDMNVGKSLQPVAQQEFAMIDNSLLSRSFDLAVYQSRMEQSATQVQISNLASQGNTGNQSVQNQQMAFSFFTESRSEELATFQWRSTDIANQMNGIHRETYIEASQRISMRFSMSVEMSGAALQGFIGASEGLPNTSDDAFNQFMTLVNHMMTKNNEIINRMFELLGAYFRGESDFESRYKSLMEQFQLLGEMTTSSLQISNGVGSVQFSSTSFSMQMEFSFSMEQSISGQVQEADPIVFDLTGDGFNLTSYQDGAKFDIQGNGQKVHTAFVTGGDAFLAIDRNGNGIIDCGRELFGDQNGAANGFEELRKLDSNGDGKINKCDDEFHMLRLWKDNGNGITEPGELFTLEELGIAEICLGYTNVDIAAMGGNRLTQIASYTRTDGTQGAVADAMLQFAVSG